MSDLNSWIYANKYPASDKLELLASCFEIPLSHLIKEVDIDKTNSQKTKNEVFDVMLRLHSDQEFFLWWNI